MTWIDGGAMYKKTTNLSAIERKAGYTNQDSRCDYVCSHTLPSPILCLEVGSN